MSKIKINNIKNSYPDVDEADFQLKIYKKREFYYHKIPKREKLEKYEEINKYRDDICKGDFKLREQQIIPTNFLSPDTPYRGLLIMHGTGTGKTCTAISIAEQFKEQVIKYNTKIYVLTSGPNIKENFKSELLFCTGETYLKNKEILEQMSSNDKERERKIAIYNALQYYKILSYKTFYKKVLGEKIAEKKIVGTEKIKTSYKKTEEGEFKREIVIDRILNLDNTILIVDEAHNMTGNEYGEAIKKIIKTSKNLRIILLSATPMKNLADDIIDMLNFLRPVNEPIKRDLIFTSEKNYTMKFKPGGEEYLKQMASGYISFFRGNIPFTFAKRIDKGVISDGLLFTPVIKCNMNLFQLNTYNLAVSDFDDRLDRSSSAAANFVYPGLDSIGKLVGYHSNEGLNKVLNQINNNKEELLKQINKTLFNSELDKSELSNFISESADKNITGKILELKYLKLFSSKFYQCILKLNRLIDGDKGAGTAFVYSNLVKAGGIELFAEALKVNGYLEYNENSSQYNIESHTIDSRTGKTFEDFKKEKKNINEFHPATFILITGGMDESGEDIPEIKQKHIRQVFNNVENKEGKLIKLVLGSRVMNEGVTLENTREVHILDVHYNLGKVDQVIGRAIRMCKHMALVSDKNRFPHVNVYRYVVGIEKGLSTDEILYQKAELKYLLVKQIERVLKEVSIDCPLLLNGNQFPEEVEKYKGCVEPSQENIKKKKTICPALCDFKECDYKCYEKDLNKYYNNKTLDYNAVDDIDYSTFNVNLAVNEIDSVKQKIKDLYRFKYVYLYEEIKTIILSSYKKEQKLLFVEYFLDKALEDMMPRTENEYNSFKDTIYDKYNRAGYLIQRGKYYIYQPFDNSEEIPMYYRTNYKLEASNITPIKNYIEMKYGKIKETNVISTDKTNKKKDYDLESIVDYYINRSENYIVGIVSKNFLNSDLEDIFKIRPPLKKTSDKKRGTGIYSLTGAVCATSKDKSYLLGIIKKLKNNINESIIKSIQIKITTREDMCENIKLMLLYLEKYSTGKDKMTYLMVPSDHPVYVFPYNLEDRIKYVLNKIKEITEREFDYIVKKNKNGTFEEILNLPGYIIEIKNNKYLEEHKSKLEKELKRYNISFEKSLININLI
jgi:DNA polymerase III delta prime subunit